MEARVKWGLNTARQNIEEGKAVTQALGEPLMPTQMRTMDSGPYQRKRQGIRPAEGTTFAEVIGRIHSKSDFIVSGLNGQDLQKAQ